MNLSRSSQSYQRVATQTASPGQLILMLYDGIIRFLEQARLGFAYDDPLEFNRTINNNVLRAQAIISELNLCLNMEQGGEVSANLRRLYHYLDGQLQKANQHKTEKEIIEVISRVTVLRDAWSEMLSKESPSSSAAARSEGLSVTG